MTKLDLSSLQKIIDDNLKWYEENKLDFQLKRAKTFEIFIDKISSGFSCLGI